MKYKPIKPERRFPNFPFLFSLIDWKSFQFRSNKNAILNSHAIEDLREIARQRTPKVVFDYVEGGSSQELSYQRSLDAFTRTEFPVKTLQNVGEIHTSQKILGKITDLPIIFAPTGYTQMMHHAAEPAVANVAENRNLVYVLSTMGTTSPEELAEKAPNVRRWMQLYVMRDRK
ncbi:MAG: alpha-hydroxy-acid oxidizing protein, partial [Candidatus Fonsibacter sp.]